MLKKIKSSTEKLISQWYSNKNDDEFELSLYTIAEDEYDSGSVSKGLLAKIGSEMDFDDKKTKAHYIKARTAQWLCRKDDILAEMAKIQSLSEEIEMLQQSLFLLEEGKSTNKTEASPNAIKRVKADILGDHEMSVANHTKSEGGFVVVAIILFITSYLLLLAGVFSLTEWISSKAIDSLWFLSFLISFSLSTFCFVSQKKSQNKTLVNLKSEHNKLINDMTEISKRALALENKEFTDALERLPQTELTLQNLIKTRDVSSKRLEELFQ